MSEKFDQKRPRPSFASSRAIVSNLIDKPSTEAEIDACVATFDELIRAVERIPTLPPEEQYEASRLVATGLKGVRSVLKRRPR